MGISRQLQIEVLDRTSTALAEGAVLLHRYAIPFEQTLVTDLRRVIAEAPFRNMITPGGFRMSVAMTSSGDFGWVTDRRGYRYSETDPETGRRWPPMPASFVILATDAARDAGYTGFAPDSCLVNRYDAGAKMSLHQDKDEADFTAPIVSVSLGLPATFLFGGPKRSDPAVKVPLEHGDVVVWGGASRLYYHGVSPIKAGHHALLGNCRINLTFRSAR